MTVADGMVRDETFAPGSIVGKGRFVIERVLGAGATSIVYEARDNVSRRQVALKVLKAGLKDDWREAQRFRNEAIYSQELPQHPNLVRIFDCGELDNGQLFSAMEYVKGSTTLSRKVAGTGGLTPVRACEITRGIAHGVACLHQAGIVHRDVKPGNVIIDKADEQEVPRLLDFGLAGRLDQEPNGRLTQMFQAPGTPDYKAPEQYVGGTSPRVSFDVYALAVVLYELLVGRTPFHGYVGQEIARVKMDPDCPEVDISNAIQGLHPELVALVNDGMRRSAKNRVPSVAEFIRRLDNVIAELKTRPKRGHRLGLLAGLGAAAAAVTAVATHVAIGPGGDVESTVQPVLRALPFESPSVDASSVEKSMADRAAPEPALAGPGPTVVEGRSELGSNFVAQEPSSPPDPQIPGSTKTVADIPTPAGLSVPAGPEISRLLEQDSAHKRAARHDNRTVGQESVGNRIAKDSCATTRLMTREMVKSKRWERVVAITEPGECWKGRDTVRLSSRLQALAALGRYKACISESRGVQSPGVVRLREYCQDRLLDG